MLDPGALAAFRKNVAVQANRAVFEIPEILVKLLGETKSPTGRTAQAPVEAEAHQLLHGRDKSLLVEDFRLKN